MHIAPPNHDSHEVPVIDLHPLMAELVAEFPDLSDQQLTAVYEVVRRRINPPFSAQIIQTRIRAILQTRGLSHSL